MKTRIVSLLSLFVIMALLAPVGTPSIAAEAVNAPTLPMADGAVPAPSAVDEAETRVQVERAFGQLPLIFVENQGQMDEQVAYYVQGGDKTIYFTPEGVTFALTAPLTPTLSQRERERTPSDSPLLEGEGPGVRSRWAVKLDFVGANPDARPVGEDKAETIISYFRGPQEEWHTGLPTYARIVYYDLWPGIDLVYYGTVNQLKYEFVVHPGADPAQIRLTYRGATDVVRNTAGQLEVTTPLGGFTDDTPIAYQEIDGQRVPVEMGYRLSSTTETAGERVVFEGETYDVRPATFNFAVGDYDPTHSLILDPAVIVYSGFIGGSGNDRGYGIAVDGMGNAYVIGYTTTADFPVLVGPDLSYNGDADAFIAKVNAAGTSVVYAGFLGGSDTELGSGIEVDDMGNVYLTGTTFSADFPAIVGPDLTYGGGWCGLFPGEDPCPDTFVAKVNAAGTILVYAGFVGGSNYDEGMDIAVDGVGNAYVTGTTRSTDFPAIGGPDLTHNGGYDTFVAKVNAAGTGFIYGGFVGGSSAEIGWGIAVDSAGNVYVTGYTGSSNFPVIGGPDLTFNGGLSDIFVAKVNTAGTALAYAGFLGGSDMDQGESIEVDSAGHAYVTGYTYSSNFPATVGPDLTHNGHGDAFVAKVNSAGTALIYAGFLGGSSEDTGYGIAVDAIGNAYITGQTESTDFPVTGGLDLSLNGALDVFVAKVNTAGTGLAYAGFLGGSSYDRGYGIAVDSIGDVYITGDTYSPEFPTIGGPDLTFNGGDYDAFVAKVSSEGTPSVGMTYTGPQYLPAGSVVIGEVDQRITMGDHVHLRLPFINTSDQPISNATVWATGASAVGSYPGVSIYNDVSWLNANQPIVLTPSTLNPGETGTADFWIFVTNPLDRQSLTGATWLKVNSDAGQWIIRISLAPLVFDIPGNDALKAGSCLHHPDNFRIQKYAQYAAGAHSMSTPPTNDSDPDTPEKAILNLVHRVNAEFYYQDIWTTRMPDTILLATRYGYIGVCRDYADLTTGLLRALGLPARYTDALFIKPRWYWFDKIVGHAWAEAYLRDGKWHQVDSRKGLAFEEGFYESDGYIVIEVWADKYPLSSAAIWADQKYQCIAPCFTTPVDCLACVQESNTQRDLWPWQQADLACVEDVTTNYHQTQKTFEVFETSAIRSSDERLLVNIQSPTFVTRTMPFTLSTSVVNSTTLSLDAITATVSISEYMDSQVALFEVMPPYHFVANLNSGQTLTLTWIVTPLVTGSGIPLRVGAMSEELFEIAEHPLVVNEPGTLPDLSLGGICGLGVLAPGQTITLSAYTLNETLQPITDTSTLITATVYATPTLAFSTAVNLTYCEICDAYQSIITVPNDAPIGNYWVDFVATHPGYDPDTAVSLFYVTPPLSLTLATSQNPIDAHDTLTLTAQVFERSAVITEANVLVEIGTPAGIITAPLTTDGVPTYTLSFRPLDLIANVDGNLLSGEWILRAVADYQGGTATVQQMITVQSAPDSITLAGPVSGLDGTNYPFTATVSPWATTPITYNWQTEEYITHTGGLSDTAVFSWTMPGLHTIVVTAANTWGMITTTHEITLCVPLTDVAIVGPRETTSTLYIDNLYTFDAVVTPTDATKPITYTWMPAPTTGQGTDSVTYRWSAPDTYTVTLTAENCGGPVAVTRAIIIQEKAKVLVYLPLVLRNH